MSMYEEIKDKLERAYAQYYNTLFKTALIFLYNEQDAYDAVQETFVRFIEHKGNFHDEEHEKAWLLRVNINICKNMLRFHKLHPTIDFLEVTLPYHDERDQGLMEALLKLRTKYKEVLILRFIEGYSNKEIAAILGTTENAVKKRLIKAKTELAREYEK